MSKELHEIHARFEALRSSSAHEPARHPAISHKPTVSTKRHGVVAPIVPPPPVQPLHLSSSRRQQHVGDTAKVSLDLQRIASTWQDRMDAKMDSLDKMIASLQEHLEKDTTRRFITWLAEQLHSVVLPKLEIHQASIVSLADISSLGIKPHQLAIGADAAAVEASVATLVGVLFELQGQANSRLLHAKASWAKKIHKATEDAKTAQAKRDQLTAALQQQQAEQNALHGQLQEELRRAAQLANDLTNSQTTVKLLELTVAKLEEQIRDQTEHLRLQEQAWKEEVEQWKASNNMLLQPKQLAPEDFGWPHDKSERFDGEPTPRKLVLPTPCSPPLVKDDKSIKPLTHRQLHGTPPWSSPQLDDSTGS
ncbi:unnamed protein product [Aphanomyces euteiches]